MPTESPSPNFTLAQQHDAAGRHDDAINELALGTQAGNVPCMRQLGKRLLIGDRAPLLAAEGARFILDAANQGDGEAAARIAALTALGLYCTQNWQDALRWLGVAAQRGWEPARGQLAVLRGDPSRGARPDINLAAWQVSPPGRNLSCDPQVRVLDEFLSAPVCHWIIEHARTRLARARVYDATRGQDLISTTRTNSVANFNLAEVELLSLLVQERMSAACGLPMRNMEAPAVLHYDVGEQITDHYDFVDPETPDYAQEIARNGQRVVTFLVYLNDDYEGGETGFPTLGFTHQGRRGEGLYFVNALPDMRPDLRMLHTGRPPTRGDKWIVSQFIRSRTTRP
ncbi:MAG: 2OG-Fe(II) oxygenase [Steroidobacteraceae bacterium]